MSDRARLFAANAFPVFAVIDGAICLAQPEFLRESAIALSMPTYILYILGLAKLLGGAVLLLPTSLLMKEWAYAGFAFWWVGGMMTHVFSGHAIGEFVPLTVIGIFLLLSFLEHRPRRAMVETIGG
jgi:hypothetical protein